MQSLKACCIFIVVLFSLNAFCLIPNGTVVTPGMYREVVKVEITPFVKSRNGKIAPLAKGTCSGTVINDQQVLTAAHCLYGKTSKHIQVTYQFRYLSKSGEQKFIPKRAIAKSFEVSEHYKEYNENFEIKQKAFFEACIYESTRDISPAPMDDLELRAEYDKTINKIINSCGTKTILQVRIQFNEKSKFDIAIINFNPGTFLNIGKYPKILTSKVMKSKDKVIQVGFGFNTTDHEKRQRPKDYPGITFGIKRYGYNSIAELQDGLIKIFGRIEDDPLKFIKSSKSFSGISMGDSGGPLLRKNKNGDLEIIGVASYIQDFAPEEFNDKNRDLCKNFYNSTSNPYSIEFLQEHLIE